MKVRLSVFVRIVLLIVMMMGTTIEATAQTPVELVNGLPAAEGTAQAGTNGSTGSRSGVPDTTPPVQYISTANFSEGFDDITNLPGWYMQNNSDPLGVTNWFQGNDTVFPAHAGAPTAYIGANFNNTAGVGTISNWLLTPEQDLADGATFSFWTRTATGSTWPDRLQVRLSTNGASTDVGTGAEELGDFTTLLLDINPTLSVGGYPEVWTQFQITLSGIPEGSSGRLAFRYYVTNGGPSGSNSNYIGIDTAEYLLPPSISLEKTVGTDPNVCAMTDQVSVLSGTTVTYCFEVTNTGGVTLTLHDLVDDQLGLILNDFPYALVPGASAFLTQTTTITESVVNTATWTAWDGSDIAEATDTATVTLLTPAISLEKTVGTDPNVCATTDQVSVLSGTTVTYCYEVVNTGTVTLTLHDLVDDQLGVILNDFPYALAPSASAFITASAVITEDVVNSATWTAWDGSAIAEATDTATVDVLEPGISLTKTVGTDPNVCAMTDQVSVLSGATVTYCFEVVNTGGVTLTLHDLVDDQLGLILDDFPYALAPSASVFITASAVITEDVVNTATWTAWDGDSLAEASDTATVDVLVPGISLVKTVGTEAGVCATTDQITVMPGTTVYYCYTVTNTGEVTLDLHDLEDDQLGTIFSGLNYSLAPGGSVNTVAAGLTIPAVITATTVNTATWTAYNTEGPSVQAEATASVVVEELMYYTFLPMVAKN